eukprot:SAG31_NODE_20960_length_561_cov_0.564935_1_plen_86_part_00
MSHSPSNSPIVTVDWCGHDDDGCGCVALLVMGQLVVDFCRNLDAWFELDPLNIACIHCKAGKGRTGVLCSGAPSNTLGLIGANWG